MHILDTILDILNLDLWCWGLTLYFIESYSLYTLLPLEVGDEWPLT